MLRLNRHPARSGGPCCSADPSPELPRLSLLNWRLHQGDPALMMSDNNLVAVDEVTKTFGEKVALSGVSFSVPAGQICGLLGPNGAGKTTLFRLLMGILKATSGTLTVDGRDAFDD